MEKANKIINNNFIKTLIGSIISIIISILGFLVFAVLLVNTDITESAIPSVIIVLSIISILIGSTISSRKVRKNGLLNGAIVGIIYITTLYILSSIILLEFKLNLYSIFMIIGAIISGMLGGIIGVNINKT